MHDITENSIVIRKCKVELHNRMDRYENNAGVRGNMELRSSEYIVKERIPANLFRSIEAVGGRLTITNERLLFTPHMINIQTEPVEINMADIVGVEKRNTIGLVPNGIKIINRYGSEFKFVVYKRAQLIELINQYRA